MSKKSRFRGPFDNQHRKRDQTLLKSPSQIHYHIHRSVPRKVSWKKSRLLTCKTLGLLVNTLATDEKHPVLSRDNLTIPIQMQLSQKEKIFYESFRPFLKSRLNFEYFRSKDDPQSFCISEIRDSENVVTKMSKKSRFRRPFEKLYGKRAQALLKSGSQNHYHIRFSLSRNLCSKKSLLLTCPILGLLVNTLATNEKYFVPKTSNLTIPIQMQLSQKQKTFSKFFAAFLKSRLNFKDFE